MQSKLCTSKAVPNNLDASASLGMKKCFLTFKVTFVSRAFVTKHLPIFA